MYEIGLLTVLLTVYELECPQKVQLIKTVTHGEIQLKLIRRHIF